LRVRRLRLAPYGPFEDLTLEFKAEARLHVVHGPNGAGKSTTLDALRSVLFGMATGARSFRFDSGRLRLGAVLERASGEQLAYTRRTSPKTPLWNAGDTEPLPGEALAPFLGHLDRQQYVQVFGLDMATLTQGGRELLLGQGDLGRALFGAALGGKRLAEVERGLKELQQELYLDRSPKARINVLRSQHDEATRALKAAQLSVNAADNERRELARLRKQAADLRAELHGIHAEQERLRGLSSALAALEPLEIKLRQREALGDSVHLEEESSREVQAALRELQELERVAAERNERVRELEAAHAAALAAAHPALLGESHAIDGLAQRRGELRARARASASTSAALAAAAAALEDALRRAGVADAMQLRTLGAKTDTQALATQLERLSEARRSAAEAETRAALEAERARAKLAALQRALGALPAELSARHAGNLAALAPFRGDLAALQTLPLPPEGDEAARAAALTAAQAAQQAAQVQFEHVRRELDQASQQLERLLLAPAGAPPTRAEVLSARSERDAALRRALGDEALATQSAISRLAAHDLARLVDRADELADRLHTEAERAAQRSECEAQHERWAAAFAESERQLAAAAARAAETHSAWRSLWEAAGVPQPDPAAAHRWRERRDQLIQRASAAQDQLTHSLRDAEQTAALRDAEHEHATRELERHAAAWTAWVTSNGLSPDEDSELLRARLHATADAQRAAQDVKRLSKERADVEREQAALVSAIAALSERCGMALAAEHVERAVRSDDAEIALAEARLTALVTGLEAERRLVQQRGDLEQRLAHERSRSAEDEAQAEQRRAVLAAAAQRVGLSARDRAALLQHAQQSDAARALDVELRALERSFAEHAAGLSVSEVRAALSEHSAASLREAREALGARAAELATQLEALHARCGALEVRFAGSGSEDAARLEASRASIEAELEEAVEEYLEVRAAQRLLQRELDRYRRETQGPLLRRAQEMFRTLTLGAYTQLHPSEERGKTVMVARREDGETVGVDGMSTGTCDQLYLALRIATVEHMLTAHEPLPFLADDLFVNFDDARTQAALAVLAELGRRTQVIVFTHHESVVQSAERLASSGVELDVLRLPGEVERLQSR